MAAALLELRDATAGYAGRAPVADGYLAFRSNGAGGTDVWVDADEFERLQRTKIRVGTMDL